MSIENAKIVNRILTIGKIIKMEIDKTLADASKKYKMDLTKSALNYSGSLIKEKVEKIINEEADKFKFIKLIVDYGSCEQELDPILEVFNSVKDKLAQELSEGSDISNLKNSVIDSMKRIIIAFPCEWGIPIVDQFKNNFLEKLRQKDIVKI